MPKRYELPDLRPRDLVHIAASNPARKMIMYIDAGGGGHWVHFDMAREPASVERGGWDLRDSYEDYTELGRLRDVDPRDIVNDWPRLKAAVHAAAPLSLATAEAAQQPGLKVGDVLTREQVAALPAGAVTMAVDERSGKYIEQWNGRGEGRCVGVDREFLHRPKFDVWGTRLPRDRQRLVALGTPADDRLALYRALAAHGLPSAVKALSTTSVGVSATETMVQVGDMVETTEEALTALPVGAVVHLWDPDGWENCVRRTAEEFRWLDHGDGRAEPWYSRRKAVIIALDCPDRDSAGKARDAFLARPYKGQEREAAIAAMVEAKITADVKAALDQVSDVGLNDQTISAVAGAVASAHPSLQTFAGQSWAADAFAFIAPQEVKNALGRARIETLDEPTAIEYREGMPEIKSTMKLDMKTETLQIDVPRLPGETDNAYAARAGALVKPQTPAPVASARFGDAIMLSAEPTWLERAAEALRPVAAELAAEAKTQTRQAIALGGVEIARAAAHRGIAAAAQALAPQHADRVVQVVDHPFTRWLENGALFLGARAAGKPALAQVGLREVVKAPMEGAAGLLVQAASQVVGAVKGALVAADEAARVEQVTGQPEAAQVSAGEVRS